MTIKCEHCVLVEDWGVLSPLGQVLKACHEHYVARIRAVMSVPSETRGHSHSLFTHARERLELGPGISEFIRKISISEPLTLRMELNLKGPSILC